MPSIAELLDKTRATAAQRRARADAAYRKHVRSAAEGRDADPDKLVQFLDDNGFEVDAFQADVERLAARLEWAATAETLPRLQRDAAAVEREVQRVDAAFEQDLAAAEAKRAAALEPLTAKLDALKAGIGAAQAAAGELRRTAPAEVHDRLRDAHRRMGRVHEQVRAEAEAVARVKAQDLPDAERRVEAAAQWTNPIVEPHPRAALQQQHAETLARYRREVEAHRAAVENHPRKVAELEQQAAAIRDEMAAIEREFFTV
jgi:chromosome segregation ATPase